MTSKALLKFGFLIVWFGATLGNLFLLFLIVTMTAIGSPQKAFVEMISKSIGGDFISLAVLGLMAVFSIVSVIIVINLYGNYVKKINTISGRKLFVIGFLASLIFYLLVFMKICHFAKVCI